MRCCTTAKTDDLYVPLANLAPGQGRFNAIDSMLSEAGVLGFEYGYSVGRSAQPGSVGSAVRRLRQRCAGRHRPVHRFAPNRSGSGRAESCCCCPHGYEGQGPEHSSARLERYLQLCAENNMQVVYPTTPAQYFHALRRQIHRRFRKPLVVMTPKSMLRMQLAVSAISELTDGGFRDVIDEVEPIDPDDGPSRATLHRQGVLRPSRQSQRTCHRQRRDRARRAALPVPGGRGEAGAGEVSGRRGDRMGAGRIAERRRVDFCRTAPA